MVLESGSNVILGYVEEVTHGVTPGSPTLKTLRATSRNVNPTVATLESQEVRASRQRSDVRHGFNQVLGGVGFQLSMEDYDDFLSYALSTAWVAVTSGSISVSVTASTKKYIRGSGSFLTDGFRPGDFIFGTGFTNGGNNATSRAVAVTALEITTDSTTMVDEGSASRTIALKGKRLDVGKILKTVTLERQFTGITQYQPNRGVAVQQFGLNVSPDSMVTGTFDLLGMSSGPVSGSSVAGAPPTAAVNREPFASFDGSIYEGGTAIAVATALNFTLNNQRSLQGVIGSKFSPDVFEGTAINTGQLSVFLENASLINKFVNETSSSIWMRFNDIAGVDFMSFIFHRVKYLGGPIDPGQQGPVVVQMPFEALENATYGTSLTIQRSNT